MTEIIDIHAHLGDIMFPNGGELIEKKNVTFQKRVSVGIITEYLTVPDWRVYRQLRMLLTKSKAFEKWFEGRIHEEGYYRNLLGTRENLRREMDRYGIVKAALLPIYPNVTFADLHAASQKDNTLIPFTGADFNNLDGIEEKFAKDVAAGAKGLKIHPILQCAAIDGDDTYRVVEAFAPYDLPILFHTGYSNYYVDPADYHLQRTDYGSVQELPDLFAAFPNVKFIAGHAALAQAWELMPLIERFNNVWVDVSFQGYPAIRDLIATLGPEKVMYASDWPWGAIWPAIRQVKRACRGDKGLERRLFYDNAAELLKL